ncbi:LacI family transcriptional regulator [Microbacterium sp. SLBN-154]|uniref:LacI family DNA-binding transcriptional regulator n=1 Tax=Microbacterium sp. SLBN-154 TaxID=2768458 RepID=UPI00114FC8F4|nr:LacI family DNA-binding transcriptional regulator [Microbacterium sp. SLBN-154]TQK18672.1 LacI family transcriptional regulator [Microbacterium sp. SLBN-154]
MNATPAATASAKRPTIVDVARHAGVSVASASKVLRDAYGVSAEMKERVRAAMKELDYRPSAAARAMRGQTYTVGLVVADIDNQFVSLLVDGISDALRATSYDVLIGPAGNDAATQARMIDALIEHRMDGLLLFAPYASAAKLAEVAAQTPTVVISRHGLAPEYDTVAGDDLGGARAVIDHLVELGHSRIAFVGHDDGPGLDPLSPQQMRERGYREAMAAHGLVDEIDIVRTAWSEKGGHDAAREILDRADRPTAIFAGADVAAIALMSECADRGISIPDELSLVGYDNTRIAALRPVSLTSVDQGARDIGAVAATRLLERIAGRTQSTQSVHPTTLVVRRSTAAPQRVAQVR